MPVESVTYISDLNPSYPLAGDAPSAGDDHLRNIKTAEKNTWPNVAGPVTATHTELNYVNGVTSAIQTQLDTIGASSLRLIATATASASAAVDFTTGISSTYEEYELHIINAVPATDAAIPWLRTSTDAGSNWDAGASDYWWLKNVSAGSGSTVTSSNDTKMLLATTGVSNDAAYGGVSGVIRFFHPAGTASRKRFLWTLSTMNSPFGLTDLRRIDGLGLRDAIADLDGVRFLFSTGNITSGLFKLYGVKKS